MSTHARVLVLVERKVPKGPGLSPKKSIENIQKGLQYTYFCTFCIFPSFQP